MALFVTVTAASPAVPPDPPMPIARCVGGVTDAATPSSPAPPPPPIDWAMMPAE